jgi:hypothetical protein
MTKGEVFHTRKRTTQLRRLGILCCIYYDTIYDTMLATTSIVRMRMQRCWRQQAEGWWRAAVAPAMVAMWAMLTCCLLALCPVRALDNGLSLTPAM